MALTPAALVTRPPTAETRPERPAYDLIELFFFAYRDFVGDADRILAEYGFGRAHHRVLHFVDRHPGLTVAELLDILRITKQSLNRVLNDLIDKGFVERRPGVADRRQRHLFATEAGQALGQRMALVQTRRISRALGEGSEDTRAAASRFLLAMVDPKDRARVRGLIARVKDDADGL